MQYIVRHHANKSVNARKILLDDSFLEYLDMDDYVKNKAFKPDEDITICTQFTIGGEQENIRRYLDADEYELLSDFEKNLEKIKDAITEKNGVGSYTVLPVIVPFFFISFQNIFVRHTVLIIIVQRRKL